MLLAVQESFRFRICSLMVDDIGGTWNTEDKKFFMIPYLAVLSDLLRFLSMIFSLLTVAHLSYPSRTSQDKWSAPPLHWTSMMYRHHLLYCSHSCARQTLTVKSDVCCLLRLVASGAFRLKTGLQLVLLLHHNLRVFPTSLH